MTEVRARTWCRVDFAGGTLDIWPLGLLHPGSSTVNVAIDLATEVTLRSRASGFRLIAAELDESVSRLDSWRRRSDTSLAAHLAEALDLPPAEIEITSESPRGGGLGASSAIAMAFIAAAEGFTHAGTSSVERRCRIAGDVEARMMGLPTGRQDHLAAVLGGLLVVRHEPGGERVEKIDLPLAELERSLVVAYSGQSHFSAGHNWQIVRRHLDGDQATFRRFAEIAQIAGSIEAALREGDLRAVGELMSAEWRCRRGLADGITTPMIETMLEVAREAGAWGGKVCGAGGGGSIAVLAPANRRAAVVEALSAVATVLPTAPCARGVELSVVP